MKRFERIGLTLLTRSLFQKNFGWKQAPPSHARPLELESPDGSRLEAALVEADAPLGVAVLCHPFSRYGMHYFVRHRLLDAVVGARLHALLFNFKGFGRSTIRGPVFADDILGVVQHARSRFPGLPVCVIGLSFGGYHLVHALARMGGIVSTAMLDSVPLDARAFFRSFPLSWAMGTLAASRWSRELGIAALDRVVSECTHFPRLLVVHGSDDVYTSTAEIEQFTRRVPSASLTTVPGAGHLECFRRDPMAYRSLLGSIAKAPS